MTELMETYGQEVWKYAYFLKLRADVADDLMQEVEYMNISFVYRRSVMKVRLSEYCD
ncbi:hypothetical protein J2T17_003307 [Paenibacillus mucilaginosus]